MYSSYSTLPSSFRICYMWKLITNVYTYGLLFL